MRTILNYLLAAILLFGSLAASSCAGPGTSRTAGGIWPECSWSGVEHYPGQRTCTFNSPEEYELTRLMPVLGSVLTARNAERDERLLYGGPVLSSCENYLKLRPAGAQPFQRSFGSTGACWKNGPALAQQCLSFCIELSSLAKTAAAELNAQEAKAGQFVEQVIARLREREAAAVAALQPTDRREPGAESVEPLVDISDKCRRYVREFSARPPSFLDIFGSKGACWRSEADMARKCNDKCGELLTQATRPNIAALSTAATPL